jgi:hypothetical protein
MRPLCRRIRLVPLIGNDVSATPATRLHLDAVRPVIAPDAGCGARGDAISSRGGLGDCKESIAALDAYATVNIVNHGVLQCEDCSLHGPVGRTV